MDVRGVDIAVIRHRLQESQALVPAEMAVPVNYVGLRENVFLRELDAEVQALLDLLGTPETFSEKFKERYAARIHRRDHTILFVDYRNSPVNQLYWDIATLTFRPATMKEMLAIMMPNVARSLEISFPDQLSVAVRDSQSLRAAVDQLVPVLTVTTLETLTNAPTLNELSHYVLTEDILFDVRHIQRFPLGAHSQVYKALQQQYPTIAEKLYAHNYVLTVLKTDILTFQEKGKTPRAALERLKNAFILGGTMMTGSEFANRRAAIGVMEFANYFDHVPKTIKEKLLLLKGRKTLHEILDDISKGNCVETTATYIEELITKNTDNPLLNAIIPISDSNNVLKRYRYSQTKTGTLLTQYDNPEVFSLPVRLLEAAMDGMTVEHPEDIIDLILNFPTAHYGLLLSKQRIQNVSAFLKSIVAIIKNEIISAPQYQALMRVILNNHQAFQFDSQGDVLTWMLKIQHVELIEWVISHYFTSKDALVTALTMLDKNGFTALHAASTKDPRLLRVILEAIPDTIRLGVIKMENKIGVTLLHCAAHIDESLETVLAIYPAAERLAAVKVASHSGNTVLHSAARNPRSLQRVLALYPDDAERLAAVKLRTQEGLPLLHIAASNAESLRIILALYPEDERLAALKTKDKQGGIVLHRAESHADSLRVILALYPAAERLAAVTPSNEYSRSILHVVASSYPDSFQVILELIPEDQRLNALGTIYHNGSLLSLAAHFPPSFLVILRLIPEANRLATLSVKRDNVPMLHYVLEQPELLQAMLVLIPKAERLAAVSVVNTTAHNDTVLHAAASKPRLLQMILDTLPEAERLGAVNAVNLKGETVLHLAAKQPDALQSVLAVYSKDQLLSAVTVADKQEKTALHHAAKNLQSLQMILDIYPKEQHLDAVKVVTHDGKTLLHLAADNPPSLQAILAIYPDETARLSAVRAIDIDKCTVLHYAVSHIESLQMILALIPKAERLQVVKAVTWFGRTALYHAAHHPNCLKAILEIYPDSERLAAVRMADANALTALHLVVWAKETNIESLRVMLELIPESERLACVRTQSTAGVSVLGHISTLGVESLRTILALIPKAERLAAVLEAEENSDSVLYRVPMKYPFFLMLLKLIPKEQHLEMVKSSNQFGNTLLHLAAGTGDLQCLRAVLALYPEDQRLNALKAVNISTQTVLHKAVSNPLCFQAVLAMHPKEQRLLALKAVTRKGRSTLHLAANYPITLQMALALYPKDDCFSAITAADQNGDTVLHLAKENLNSLELLLEAIPAARRLEALKGVNQKVGSVLHSMKSLGSLKVILQAIPEAERLTALNVTNQAGVTLLESMAAYYSYVYTVLKILPRDKRLEVFKAMPLESITQFISQSRSEDLQAALELIPPAERLEAVTRVVPGVLPNSIESLQVLINAIPEAERLTLVKTADSECGNTMLHFLANDSDCSKMILLQLPDAERVEASNVTNQAGKTVWYYAATSYHYSLLEMLETIPADQRSQVVTSDDQKDKSLLRKLYQALPYPKNSEMLVKVYYMLFGSCADRIVKRGLLNFVDMLGQLLREVKPSAGSTNQIKFFSQGKTARGDLVMELHVYAEEIGRLADEDVSASGKNLQTLLTLQSELIVKVKAFKKSLSTEDQASEWFERVALYLEKNKLPVDMAVVRDSSERVEPVVPRLASGIHNNVL